MKDKIIKEWFQSWFTPDWDDFDNTFESEIYYSESWGPEYYGINEIKVWKNEWHKNTHLNNWSITKLNHIHNTSFIEWHFSCFDNKEINEFDGISVIEWGKNNKIKSLKEFASSLPKYNPIEIVECTMDNKYPYHCKEMKISELTNNSNFNVVCQFNKKDILNDHLVKELFNKIRHECSNGKIWALLGGNVINQYICLQVASSSAIATEIISDIKCMMPFNKMKDIKSWSGTFYKDEIFKVKYGLDARCQKYNDMYCRFNEFCIILINPDEYLKNIDTKGFHLINYAEVKFAYDTKALYWKPNTFKKENLILKELTKNPTIEQGL